MPDDQLTLFFFLSMENVPKRVREKTLQRCPESCSSLLVFVHCVSIGLSYDAPLDYTIDSLYLDFAYLK